jgi:hypothetical protein
MRISLSEAQAINDMATILSAFLPGNPHPYAQRNISFAGAAYDVGVGEFWAGGSKLPAIITLLSKTLESKRDVFCNLIVEIVRRGSAYRTNKGNPITREEIEMLNGFIAKVGFKIPELWDNIFLDSLPSAAASVKQEVQEKVTDYGKITEELLRLSKLEPHARGFAFEKFLKGLFDTFKLGARGSFRLVGEQIDSSFALDGETYLIEARWQNEQVGNQELLAFRGKVDAKATWSRGLFISYSGFSKNGLDAFLRGRATNIIGMTGEDLWCLLESKIPLPDAIRAKTRHAAETGEFLVRIYDLMLR